MSVVRYAVAFDRAAQRDLEQIYAYVRARAGGRVASAYVRRIHDHCRTLARFPERGTRRDDLRPGLRTMGFERRVTIVFRVDRRTRQVTILAIAHGGREFEAEFMN